MIKHRDIPDWTNEQLVRFWQLVTKSAGCWEWCGPVNKEGRGLFCYGDSQSRVATRVMFRLVRGYLDSSLGVLHTCDNPNCVNPDHLIQGTQLDNMQQMRERNRAADISGAKNPRAILTADDVKYIRQSNRRNVDLSRFFGVNYRTISAIRHNKIWKTVD